jgi:2-polyprenyl-6-hydroxyphenyl methylase / 3-demethylubiquinone-9 3-methyltransferase
VSPAEKRAKQGNPHVTGNLHVMEDGGREPTARGDRAVIDNAWYDDLGARWHAAWDHPVALLRAENALKAPWVAGRLEAAGGGRPARVLDIGCGGGFLARALAERGHRVAGLDVSLGSLRAARGAEAAPGGARGPAYLSADAYRLPFPGGTFDAVCALDFLEHVTAPGRVIAEAARVLRPGGLFFFHTFNRNPLAWLVVIKGVEWFVRGAPRRMHVLPLFLKPSELERLCAGAGLRVEGMRGLRPRCDAAFWTLLRTRRVPEAFRFRFARSLALGYLGTALKPAA